MAVTTQIFKDMKVRHISERTSSHNHYQRPFNKKDFIARVRNHPQVRPRAYPFGIGCVLRQLCRGV